MQNVVTSVCLAGPLDLKTQTYTTTRPNNNPESVPRLAEVCSAVTKVQGLKGLY